MCIIYRGVLQLLVYVSFTVVGTCIKLAWTITCTSGWVQPYTTVVARERYCRRHVFGGLIDNTGKIIGERMMMDRPPKSRCRNVDRRITSLGIRRAEITVITTPPVRVNGPVESSTETVEQNYYTQTAVNNVFDVVPNDGHGG